MATTDQAERGAIISTWLTSDLADQVKHHAEQERRSISSLVRNVLEDTFADTGEGRRPAGVSFPC